jgi:hypothetical protein
MLFALLLASLFSIHAGKHHFARHSVPFASEFTANSEIYDKLEGFLNFTSIASLVASPTKNVVAWVAIREGVSNLFSCDLDSRKTLQLTRYTEVCY